MHLQGNRNNIFDRGDNVYLHDLRNDTDNGVRRGVLYFYNTSRGVKLIGKDVSFVEKRHLYNQGRNVSANGWITPPAKLRTRFASTTTTYIFPAPIC